MSIDKSELLWESEVVELLRQDVERAGGPSAWSRRRGVNPTNLRRMMESGSLQPHLLRVIGYSRVTLLKKDP
jgi:hypothetical protein